MRVDARLQCALWRGAALIAASLFGPALPVHAQHSEAPLEEVRPGAVLYATLVNVIEAKPVAGGYDMLLEPVPDLSSGQPPVIGRFRAVIGPHGLPWIHRLFLIMDIQNRRQPRVLDWSFVRQRACIPPDWEARYGISLESTASSDWESESCGDVSR